MLNQQSSNGTMPALPPLRSLTPQRGLLSSVRRFDHAMLLHGESGGALAGMTVCGSQEKDEPDLELEFRALAAQWHRETDHLSNATRKAMHPAYQQIIGKGERIVPYVLRDLESVGGYWFWALNAITGQDAAVGSDSYDGAVHAWLEWGSRHNYR